jgi:hypothetical protein
LGRSVVTEMVGRGLLPAGAASGASAAGGDAGAWVAGGGVAGAGWAGWKSGASAGWAPSSAPTQHNEIAVAPSRIRLSSSTRPRTASAPAVFQLQPAWPPLRKLGLLADAAGALAGMSAAEASVDGSASGAAAAISPMCPARARIVGARACGLELLNTCRRFDGRTAAMSHAAAGGPRGREPASTVAGAKRQATSGHGAFEISTGQKSVETAGGARTKPGPATQNTQWVSSAWPSGAPGSAGAALSCRQVRSRPNRPRRLHRARAARRPSQRPCHAGTGQRSGGMRSDAACATLVQFETCPSPVAEPWVPAWAESIESCAEPSFLNATVARGAR